MRPFLSLQREDILWLETESCDEGVHANCVILITLVCSQEYPTSVSAHLPTCLPSVHLPTDPPALCLTRAVSMPLLTGPNRISKTFDICPGKTQEAQRGPQGGPEMTTEMIENRLVVLVYNWLV